MNGFSIILLENSTAQRAYPLEYRMSWILKVVHHLWRTKIPLATMFGCISSIQLAFFSGCQDCQCPSLNFEAYSLIFLEVRAQESSLSFLSSSKSLNIDMKIVRSLNFWGAMFFLCRSASITMSQRSRASNPSIWKTASNEVTSDSVELCETEVCFLHV